MLPIIDCWGYERRYINDLVADTCCLSNSKQPIWVQPNFKACRQYGAKLPNAGGSSARQRGRGSDCSDIAPIIAELQAVGATSLRAIAAGLNDRGIPTARGNGTWSAVQVARVMARQPQKPRSPLVGW
jgi:hypothetical protein